MFSREFGSLTKRDVIHVARAEESSIFYRNKHFFKVCFSYKDSAFCGIFGNKRRENMILR